MSEKMSKSTKFENNHAYNVCKTLREKGELLKSNQYWANLCPAEKVRLLEGERVEYTTGVHESKYGFHPCDRATYLKLKALHAAWWRAVSCEYEWERWNRKEPQNRVIRRKIKDDKGVVTGSEVVGEREEPCRSFAFRKTFDSQAWNGPKTHTKFEFAEIVVDYKNARTPSPKDQVPKLRLSAEQIDELYEEVCESGGTDWIGQAYGCPIRDDIESVDLRTL